jgi:hypothetical protein
MTRRIAPARTPTCEHGNRHTKLSTGGMVRAPTNMAPTNGTLCSECPLRRDSKPGYLGGYTPEMYLEVMGSGASIACHMSKGFNAQNLATQRHCTGVAAYRAHTGTVCMVRTEGGEVFFTGAHESTRIAATFPEIMARVFDSPKSFVAHHRAGQEDS